MVVLKSVAVVGPPEHIEIIPNVVRTPDALIVQPFQERIRCLATTARLINSWADNCSRYGKSPAEINFFVVFSVVTITPYSQAVRNSTATIMPSLGPCNERVVPVTLGLMFECFEKNEWSLRSDKNPLVVTQDAQRYYGISGDKNERERADYIFPLAKIFTCFLVARIALFFGLPESNIQGFLLIVGGLIAFMIGFGLLLHLTENTWSAEDGASAPCYRSAEDVRVLPIVVSELKFGHVERHIFRADFMEGADNTAFQDRPETFNRVGVDGTNNIFMFAVSDEGVRKFLTEFSISAHVIGNEKADFVGYRLADETAQCGAVEMLHDAGKNITLAADRADNTDLAGPGPARTAAALVPMFILVLSADVGFVHFDDASELVGLVFAQSGADAIAHGQRGFIGAEAHDALDLQCFSQEADNRPRTCCGASTCCCSGAL
jgi:hypothetical protein